MAQNIEAGRPQRNGLPRHIAMIMDGNGRWARKRGLPRTAGHAAGAETFRRIATYCKDIGIEYLTVYAFSTENWSRSKEEVGAIMGLLVKYLREAVESMEKDGIRLRVFGDVQGLSEEQRRLITETDEISRRVTGMQVNVCINYGGRDEIVRAAGRWAAENPGKTPTEEEFSRYLYSAGVPDPDLIIRSGGEKRLSNFLLWQAAYAELYFTDTLWPDMTGRDVENAIEFYRGRERRYGGVK